MVFVLGAAHYVVLFTSYSRWHCAAPAIANGSFSCSMVKLEVDNEGTSANDTIAIDRNVVVSRDAIEYVARDYSNFLVTNDGQMFVEKNGLWVSDGDRIIARSKTYRILNQERDKDDLATYEYYTGNNNRHLDAVIDFLKTHFIEDPYMLKIDPDRMNRYDIHRVLPFSDGTAYDFRNGRLLKTDELRELWLEDFHWSIPPTLPGGDVDEDFGKGILQRYGIDWLQLMAMMLREGPTRNIDLYIGDESEVGKSFILTGLVSEAFPGAIGSIGTPRYLREKSETFSQFRVKATEKILAITDEFEKAEGGISPTKPLEYTESVFDIEKKRLQPVEKRRIARMGWCGAKHPPIKAGHSGHQGVKNRMKYCAKMPINNTILTPAMARKMLEHSADFRKMLITLASEPIPEEVEQRLIANGEEVYEQMIAEFGSDEVSIPDLIKEYFTAGESWDYIESSRIIEVIRPHVDSKTKDQKIYNEFIKVFPKAKSENKKIDGKPVKVRYFVKELQYG